MALKLSIFTTTTNPGKRGDNVADAMRCYKELADEVINVSGDSNPFIGINNGHYKVVHNKWPKEFHWLKISEQFQKGYEASSGDWVIHMDLDFLFHEQDFEAIRQAIEEHNNEPALSFWKYQFIAPDRYNLKSRLVLAVNKGKFGDRIKFDGGGQGDFCQPSLDGNYLNPDFVQEAKIPFYNYEKMTKTAEQIKDDCGRMDRAYHRHFGKYQLSKDGSDEQAYEGYMNMLKGRISKPQKHISLSEHPKYIQDTIRNLRPDQFGHDGFGMFTNDYLNEFRLNSGG